MSVTDGCIELFRNISSDLPCLGVRAFVLTISRVEGGDEMQEEAETP